MKKFYNENREAILFLLEVFKNNKKLWVMILLFSAITSAISTTLPFLAKIEIDQLSYKYNNLFGVIYLEPFYIFLLIIWIIILFDLSRNFISWLNNFYTEIRLEKIKNDFFLNLYKKLENIEPGHFANEKINRIITENLSDSWFIKDILNMLTDLIKAVITLFWIAWVFMMIDYKIFIVIIITGLITYFVNLKRESNSIYDYFEKYEILWKLNYLKRNVIENFNKVGISWWTSILFDFLDRWNIALQKVDSDFKKKDFKLNIIIFLVNTLSENIIKIIVWVTIYYYSWSIWLMTMTIMYSWQFNSVLFNFMINKFSTDRVFQHIWNLEHLLFLTNEKKYKTENISDISNITIKNLNFRYPKISENELKYFNIALERLKKYDSKYRWWKEKIRHIEQIQAEAKEKSPEILKWINLKLEKWNIYWIVGKNWTWKTTFANLIMNYFDSYEWNILFNQTECKNLKREFFFSNIWVITQIPFLFKRLSIKENLLMWTKNNITDEYIFELLEKFWLKNKVEKMKKWLECELGYDSYFSGWEEQLLVLIRLILQDKKILILDEWTNQLDAENEILVMNELLKNKKDKIIIFITHRMTTIKKADTIHCIEDWEIKHSWKHEELVWKENIYAKFWHNQVEKWFE